MGHAGWSAQDRFPIEPATVPVPGAGLPATSIPGLVLLDAVELSWLIRRREVSCVDVMRTFLAHIDRFNPMVNAIVSRAEEPELLAQAEQRDRELDRGECAGWLHGMPIAVKDLSDAVGFPTTGGTPLLRDQHPDSDSLVVARMRAEGAIVIGKTNVPAFGLGSHTTNELFGTTRNPYDPERTAGGSSGGAAAALAMRLLPVADGTDFMGSLRNPAAYCNVIGLRPSFGRVPTPGFLSEPSVFGPLGRTIRDTAMLLSTMAGYDRSGPLALREDATAFTEPLDEPPTGLRVGWLGDCHGYFPVESAVLDCCRAGLAIFDVLDAQVTEVEPLPLAEAWEAFRLWRHWMLGQQLFDLHADEATRELLPAPAHHEIDGYLAMSVRDIARAIDGRNRWYATVSALFDHYDVLVAPSAQLFPFNAELAHPTEINGRAMDTYHRWMEIVAPWSLSGHPVLNVPVGFDERGLPMGVQLIGRSHSELDLLRLGHAYERETDWTHRVLPPLLR